MSLDCFAKFCRCVHAKSFLPLIKCVLSLVNHATKHAALVAAVADAATPFAAAVNEGLRGMLLSPAHYCCCCYCRTPWDVLHVVAVVVDVVVMAVETRVVKLVVVLVVQ